MKNPTKLPSEYVMDEIMGLKNEVQDAIGDLACAETVETNKDLIANLEAAVASLDKARKSIYDQLVRARMFQDAK
jgi:hypothetical protein